MQINFYSNKEGIIELFNWIKKEFPELDFYSWKDNARFNERNLYLNEVGYHDKLYLTLKNSELSNKMICYNKCDYMKLDFLLENGIEFYFGYSDNKIYNYNFKNYNPQDRTVHEPFFPCRIYLNSYYLGDNDIYIKIYKKLSSRIRRNSIRLNYDYIEAYLYNKCLR